jgi:hypothetical protein
MQLLQTRRGCDFDIVGCIVHNNAPSESHCQIKLPRERSKKMPPKKKLFRQRLGDNVDGVTLYGDNKGFLFIAELEAN